MTYQLGIDLGTTYTAAAICRATERSSGGADVVTLGARSATVASVMYLADDGSVLVGEAAERRALTDPDRVVREFKRRIGDEIPLMIGGRPFQAHELGARMIRWVVDLVSEREGGPPRRIAVTHPASWGAHKKDLLGRALRDVGLTVTFLAEPQAAAVSYASAERVDAGSTVAVYDLGGGTFDAAVVRKNNNGTFELLGQPEGIERLGGVDFDEAVFSHVRDSLGGQLDSLDPEDPNVLSAVARLRRECVEAKEALSSDTEATIPVLLPELRTQTRLVRSEFEAMIRPALEETIVALRRAVSSAGLRPDDLSAVLLVGGSSRIPLVSQLVSDELGRPVAVDADPKTAIAMGAALAISPQPVAAAAARPAPIVAPPPMQQPRPQGLGPSAAAAAAGAGAGAAYLARSGGPSGGPGGHSGPPPGPPPRPMSAEPPPRPDAGIEPAGFVNSPRRRGGDDDGYYAEPAKRKQTGLLIGIGGVLAIAAILAAVLFWPKSTDTNSTSNSSDLTPSTAVPSTPTEHSSSGGSNTHVNRPTPKPPTRTTINQTTTRTAPPSSPSAPSTKPSEPKTPTSSSNTGGNTGGGGNSGEGSNPGDTGNGTPQSQPDNSNQGNPNGNTGSSAASATNNGTNNPFGSQGSTGDQSGTGQVGTNPNSTRQINPQVTASNAPPGAGTQPRNAESNPSGAEGSSVQQPWAQSGGAGRAVAQPNTVAVPSAPSPAADGSPGTT
ncbi:MAG TPA: Hsp70 family protein [Pseudonocardia sp.]|jgi:actin-like ATPase involved in cell morphogenesis|nr:Hsp70 family protein [Pseudonocardia sp.]